MSNKRETNLDRPSDAATSLGEFHVNNKRVIICLVISSLTYFVSLAISCLSEWTRLNAAGGAISGWTPLGAPILVSNTFRERGDGLPRLGGSRHAGALVR